MTARPAAASARLVRRALVHRIKQMVDHLFGPARCTAHDAVGRLVRTDGPSVWVGPLGLGRRFGRDESGAYALEFALLALPFFGLLFAIMEVGWVSFNGEQLQAAVDKAARQVLTGQAQKNNYTTAATFTSNLLCPTTGGRILPSTWDCSKLIVDVRTAKDFTTADMTRAFYTGTLQYCLGNPSTIVVLRVVYPLPAIFPLSIYNQFIGLANDVPNTSGWSHVLMGTAVFKTEPYSGSSPTC